MIRIRGRRGRIRDVSSVPPTGRLARSGRRILVVGLVAAASVSFAGGTAEARQADVRGSGARPAELVKDQYIVVLKKSVRADKIPATAAGLVNAHGGKVLHTYGKALHGFSVTTNEAGARRLAGSPNVDFVQQSRKYTTNDTQNNPPSWGLDRIDQSYYPLSNSYTYPTTATNVVAYVIDTGIRYSHQEFGGRAVFGFDAFGGDGSDCQGHGTHVAGTIGGTTTGVAKGVKLVSVRVLDCNGNGTTDTVLAGLNFVATNTTFPHPAVANMSLGGDADDPVDQAVANVIAGGVPVIVSAGNENAYSCVFSPARAPQAITVGATDITDKRADFSNWGPCNDLFGPGVDIVSAGMEDTVLRTASGTSMAAPHVTGAAALMLAQQPATTPAQVHSALVANTNKSHRVLDLSNTNPPANPPPAGTWQTNNPPSTGTASRIAMVSNGGRVDAFVVSNAPGHPVLHATLTGNTWSAWENLGGSALGNPTAIWTSSTRLDVFVSSGDRAVWNRTWNGSAWTPWTSWGGYLGGNPTADIVAVSPEPGQVDVYATGGDLAIWERTFDGYDFFDWQSFDGTTLAHNFSVVVDPLNGREFVFAQSGGALWYLTYDQASLSLWLPLHGTLRHDIKAVALPDGQIEVFVVGTDNAAWHRRWNRSAWSPWESLGGTVSGFGVEAVGWDRGLIDVFAKSSGDGKIWTRHFDNGWTQWTQLGSGTSATIPSATSLLTYQLRLAYPLTGGNVYSAAWN